MPHPMPTRLLPPGSFRTPTNISWVCPHFIHFNSVQQTLFEDSQHLPELPYSCPVTGFQNLETGWLGAMVRQGVCAAPCGQSEGTSLHPSHSPWTARPPHGSLAPGGVQVPTCEVVGDPAVPRGAAILEAAVPRGQDVQVLLAQQRKAPGWRGRCGEAGTEPGARREPQLPAPSGSSGPSRPLSSSLRGHSSLFLPSLP